MLFVGLARRAKGAERAAFDRRDVRRAQANGRAELVMRVRVTRIGLDALTRERQSALYRVTKRRRGFRWRRRR